MQACLPATLRASLDGAKYFVAWRVDLFDSTKTRLLMAALPNGVYLLARKSNKPNIHAYIHDTDVHRIVLGCMAL